MKGRLRAGNNRMAPMETLQSILSSLSNLCLFLRDKLILKRDTMRTEPLSRRMTYIGRSGSLCAQKAGIFTIILHGTIMRINLQIFFS